MAALGADVLEERVCRQALHQHLRLVFLELAVRGGDEHHHFGAQPFERVAQGIPQRAALLHRVDQLGDLFLGDAQRRLESLEKPELGPRGALVRERHRRREPKGEHPALMVRQALAQRGEHPPPILRRGELFERTFDQPVELVCPGSLELRSLANPADQRLHLPIRRVAIRHRCQEHDLNQRRLSVPGFYDVV